MDEVYLTASRRRRRVTVRRAATAVAAVAVIVAGSLAAAGSHSNPAAAAGSHSNPAATRPVRSALAPAPTYDLALGDSLAAGVGASRSADGYVNLVFRHEVTRRPGLRLVDLACSGATTTSVIDGGGCPYAAGSQLGAATAFLHAHAGHIAFVTIDIGINNVDGCVHPTEVDDACSSRGLATISDELPRILSGLSQADPGVPIYGMDYYDPYLAYWRSGPQGPTVARESEAESLALNATLAQVYADAGTPMADPATLFDTADFSMTGTVDGVAVPRNVAVVCSWTFRCVSSDIHPNDTGHAALAASVDQVIDQISVPATLLDPAVSGRTYVAPLTADGGARPYRWSLVPGSGPLPPGLHLERSGAIVGTPSRSGTYPLLVQVTGGGDSDDRPGVAELSLTVLTAG
jgi:lysophospholipase L1-like esterase